MRTVSIALVLLASATAHADPRVTTLAPTCALVEAAPEGLDDAERERTQQVLARTLEQADVLVVDRECTETYRVAYRDGMIELSGPRTTVREVRSPDVGDQLASLVQRERAFRAPVEEPEQQPEQHPDDAAAEAPDDQEDDAEPAPTTESSSAEKNLFYLRFGAGAVAGFDGGHALAVGVRVEMGKADFDLSLGTLSNATYGKVEVLSSPPVNRTGAYAGGGLSLSSVEGNDHSGAGLAAELSAGVTLSESHRWFLQGDASLPFYKIDSIYPATVAISLGYAFAKR